MPHTIEEAREVAGYVAIVLGLSVLCAAAGAGLAVLVDALIK